MGNFKNKSFVSDVSQLHKESDFSQILELLPAAIYTCDAKGYITQFNRAAVALWGRVPELEKELWCGSWKIYSTDGSLLSLDECPMAITLREGRPVFDQEIIIETPTGERKHIQPYPQPIFDSGGVLTGAVNMLVDITAQRKVKQNFKESEERFRFMADVMPQKVWTCTPDGRINYLNRQWIEYSGLTLQEAMSEEGKKVVHPEDFELLRDTWRLALRSGQDFEIEQRFRRSDGTFRWHLVRGVAQKDSRGKIIQWIGTNTDIHDKKEQVEGFRKDTLYTRSLIEASLDSLFAIDLDGKITDVNGASMLITGCTRRELLNTDFFNYCTQPHEASAAYKKIIQYGFVTNLPLTLKHNSGQITEVLCNGSVYKNEAGKIQGIVFIARDITEQKKTERELINAKDRAEKAMRIAEDAMKAKQQFLSNMSHEIRTPMNAIVGFTKVILKMELSPHQREYLEAIKVSGDALIVLINDILDLAKVESGKMEFEKNLFNLRDSLATILNLFEYRLQEKNLKMILAIDPAIPQILIGDMTRLHQILLNLVSNAVKFTEVGEISIKINIYGEDEEKISLEFILADTGIGIDALKVSSIFESFQQATSQTSRLFGGTGLGLAIVKELVEHQGGAISVESKLKQGTTFRFILDFQKPKGELIMGTPSMQKELLEQEGKLKSLHVLVAEDIPLNQLLIKTLLDDFGFTFEVVFNGLEAIEKLKNGRYDIILMDLQMPEMNGIECTQYIRNTLRLDLPIIALTADVTTVDLDKCRQIGMNDYIAKPLNEDLLYNKIISHVKEHRLQNASPVVTAETHINLDYLRRQTKSNPVLMKEMISLYLKQTPPLVELMKVSAAAADWEMVYETVHKIIPSFAIMGIDPRYEEVAKMIQENAYKRTMLDQFPGMIEDTVAIINKVCRELELELLNTQYLN